jgi:uncharacterized protein YdiU (UPF0061 family)
MSSSQPPTVELPEGFAGLVFSNRYARLPERFYAKVDPKPVPAPAVIRVNHGLAQTLGLDPAALETPAGAMMLAGNAVPPGAEPLAQAYAGHQFGYFNPQLGDGRAILLGEVLDQQGIPRDIQLKGSGRTPFSRGGDGRAPLGPVIREYVVSEAMHALGIKTTRALAAVATGAQVYRETALPGAVLTRVAASHVRVGTFEYFRGREDHEAIKQLADFVIDRHYPHVVEANNPYLALLDAVIDAQASLVASWLQVGFIHGVMNTDNTSISGETIDFGPCAFMDHYDPATVFSSIDREGRYAYGRQPNIALWNMARFAECLLPLFDSDTERAVSMAEEHLSSFSATFDRYWRSGMRAKLGLTQEEDGDQTLIESLLQSMREQSVDYTLAFRYLSKLAQNQAKLAQDQSAATDVKESLQRFIGLFGAGAPAVDQWVTQWRNRLEKEDRSLAQIADDMLNTNPAYIPRNHRIEAVIRAAIDDEDYGPMHEMVQVLGKPFDEQPGMELYAEPPEPGEEVLKTFCGT